MLGLVVCDVGWLVYCLLIVMVFICCVTITLVYFNWLCFFLIGCGFWTLVINSVVNLRFTAHFTLG